MARSFGLVDDKIAEADFFLEKLATSSLDFFAARCYFNAFVSASRSITFSLQAVMADIEGFTSWYDTMQQKLRDDALAKFFVNARNITQKVGENPVTGGSMRQRHDAPPEVLLKFSTSVEIKNAPNADVLTACRAYLSMLVGFVLDCYKVFGRIIDTQQYYTEEAFAARGLTIEDAEEEIIGIRGWTKAETLPDEARWQLLRDSLGGCGIDHMFEKYTGQARPAPTRVAFKSEVKSGWAYIPAELCVTGDPDEDVRLFIDSLKRSKDK